MICSALISMSLTNAEYCKAYAAAVENGVPMHVLDAIDAKRESSVRNFQEKLNGTDKRSSTSAVGNESQ
jgi:hypothetical protein